LTSKKGTIKFLGTIQYAWRAGLHAPLIIWIFFYAILIILMNI